jgi:hypothetical protein
VASESLSHINFRVCIEIFFLSIFSLFGGVIEDSEIRKERNPHFKETMKEKESALSPIHVSSSEAFELSEELKFPHEWNVIH